SARVLQDALLGASAGGHWHVETAAGLASGLSRLTRGGVDAVLARLDEDDPDRLDAVRTLCAAAPGAALVVLTAYDEEDGRAAVRAGAHDYLVKGPIDRELLSRTLHHALERKRTSDTLLRLEKAVGTMQLGVTITDVHGHIVYTNAAEADMHGYTVDEMLRMDARDLSPPANWKPLSPEDLGSLRRWKRERV